MPSLAGGGPGYRLTPGMTTDDVIEGGVNLLMGEEGVIKGIIGVTEVDSGETGKML